MPGKHAAATVGFSQTQAIVQVACHRSHHHRGGAPFIVNVPDSSFTFPQNGNASVTSTPFSVAVPDLCQGGEMRIRRDPTFTAMVSSQ